MNKSAYYLILAITTLTLMVGGMEAQAKPKPRPGDVGPGDPWHAAPNDFLFGNHIDTHVQLRLEEEDGQPEELRGSFYIIFTGEIDQASGLPIARHPRGAAKNEVCGTSPITCVVGWYMDGEPGAAKFLYHSGVNGNDHPVWMVNRAEEVSAPVTGMVIPQPGYFSHFHWITSTSTDPRAGGVPAECEKNNAAQLQDQDPTAVDKICQGWFLQIKAVKDFAFKHAGGLIPVYAGEDLATHLNILTNFNNDVVITKTR